MHQYVFLLLSARFLKQHPADLRVHAGEYGSNKTFCSSIMWGRAHVCVCIGITHMGSASPGLIGSKNINMIDGLLSLLLPGPRECVNVV